MESKFISKRSFSKEDPWHPHHAINEIEVYSDLLDHLQDRIDCLKPRDGNERVALINVQAVLSSYAFEIAMKSLWALDHLYESVPHEHSVVKIFNGLKDETKKSLEEFQLTRQVLEGTPKPFVTNRYSMEHEICSTIQDGYYMERDRRSVTLYSQLLLRKLAQILRDKVKDIEGASPILLETVDLSAE